MGVLIFIVALTIMFRQTYCYQATVEFDLPNTITTIANATTQFFVRAIDTNPELEGPTLEETLKTIKWSLVSYMATLLSSMRRVEEMRPNVEMGPGVFKTEIVTYPPNYFVNRLKTLLKIKKKEEEQNKPLN